MALPFKQEQTNTFGVLSAAATSTVTFPNPVKAGSTLLVVAGEGGTTLAIASITDTAGNTYVKIDAANNSVRGELWAAYNTNPSVAGPTVTITWGASGAAVAVIIAEYSGPGKWPLDAHSSAVATSATAGSTVITPVTGQATELVIGWCCVGNTTAITAGSGYGNLITKAQTSMGIALEDKTVTTTGAQTAQFTNTAAVWVAGTATFAAGSRPTLSALRPHPFSPGIAR